MEATLADQRKQRRKASKQLYREQLRNIRRKLRRIDIQRASCKSTRMELAGYAIAALRADAANLDSLRNLVEQRSPQWEVEMHRFSYYSRLRFQLCIEIVELLSVRSAIL
jgi:hypothetical protein